jgi:hypothetical protein
MRITVDGNSKELSVKRTWDPDRWNPSAGRATGSRESVKSINAYLDSYQSRVYQAKRKLVEDGHVITASAIKDGLSGRDQIGKMLIKIFEDYNNNVKSLIGIDYSESTWTKYDRTRRLTKEFVKWNTTSMTFTFGRSTSHLPQRWRFGLKRSANVAIIQQRNI